MPKDVLIVDDVKSYLDNLGLAIKLNLRIEPFLADDPNQAFEILRLYPIKVLVTDQIMPNMTGTQLVRKMHDELDLKIPCILLTGYSDRVDVAEAVNLGFFRFIHKDRAQTELIEALREALLHYDVEVLSKSGTPAEIVLAKKRSLIALRPNVTSRIIKIISIVTPFVKEQDWKTYLVAERGLSTKKKVNVAREAKTSYEYSVEESVTRSIGIDLGDIIPKLKVALTKLETQTKQVTKVLFEQALRLEVDYEVDVSEITDAPTKEGIVLQSREYQSAPVFTRINCLVEVNCSYCKTPQRFTVSIDLPTDSLALRQIENYDKGQPRAVYTAIVPANTRPLAL